MKRTIFQPLALAALLLAPRAAGLCAQKSSPAATRSKYSAEKFATQPFFEFLAFTAPHFPLQDIARHQALP